MRIRPAIARDLPEIYGMGYDAWGERSPYDTYIQQGLASAKHKKGTWFVLEDERGNIVSSLISYKHAFGLSANCAGIGSIATKPDQRKKGYALFLIKGIVRQLVDEKINHVFLYSDIPPAFYEKIGFQALNEKAQRHKPSVCMVFSPIEKTEDIAVPSYF